MFKKLAAGMLLTWLGMGTAQADPFVEAQGEGRIIVSAIHTESSRSFDRNGNLSPIPDYDQNQIYVQAQYGLTDDLTILLTPSFRDVEVAAGNSTSGLGYTDVGARYRLAHGDDWVVSAQGLVRIPGKKRKDRVVLDGNGAQYDQVWDTVEYDMRVGAGYSMGPSFVSAEAGYRIREGDPPNEFHADLVVGSHVTPEFMLLGTLLNTFSDGRGQGMFDRSHRYGDLYVSGVYDLNEHVSFQAGYTQTIYGKNALRQRGPFIGLWYKF
ncbi:MAG: hypothetical protein AB7E05_01735 [Sphingobium sp.]